MIFHNNTLLKLFTVIITKNHVLVNSYSNYIYRSCVLKLLMSIYTLDGGERCLADKTVVIVTHRPAALEICDRVIDFSEIITSET